MVSSDSVLPEHHAKRPSFAVAVPVVLTATLDAMDFESNTPPPQANPTGRALPTHGRHQGSTGPVRSAFATVDGGTRPARW